MYVIYVNGIVMVTIGLVPEITANLLDWKNCFFFFLQGRFYLKNRQKPTATLIYTDNIIYNIYTTYIPPPPIINTFSDVKIHVSKVHVHQNSKR